MVDEFALSSVKAGKPAKAVKSATPGVPRCFERWDELFRQKWGMAPKHLAPGKYAAHFRELLKAYGEVEVLDLMARFFASNLRRIVGGGYTVSDFYQVVPTLLLEDRKPQTDDSRTMENLAAARRAMRKR